MFRSLFALAAIFGCISVSAQQFLSRFNDIAVLKDVDGTVFFAADDGVHGTELWITDGTREGTVLVSDLAPGTVGSNPSGLIAFNGLLYFVATTLQYGSELWKSDGTPGGTVLVTDLRSGHNLGSDPYFLTVFQGKLYFAASPDGFNTSFYQTDGSSGGTVLLKDVGFGEITEAEITDDYLYFVFNDALWQSDGSPAGTAVVDVDELPYAGNLKTAGNTLFFATASGSGSTVRLYATTGTTPVSLKEFSAAEPGIALSNFTDVNSRLYFSLTKDLPDSGNELWVSDGTTTGTVLVESFEWTPPDQSTAIRNFAAYNGNLYFQGASSANYSLWTSDGTKAGTIKVSDAQLGYPYFGENRPVESGGSLFFSGDGELWISDGSSAGTRQFFDINQGQVSIPQFLTDVDGELYFVANDGYGISLWNDTPSAEVDIQTEFQRSELSGAEISFDPVQVDGCAVKAVDIVNAGAKELIISEVQISGQDFFVQGNLPPILKPGERLPFNVYFVPVAPGKRTGLLSIRTNDSNEGSYELTLVGESVEGEIPAFCDAYNSATLKKQLLPDTGEEIVISNNAISENSPAGTIVGTLSLADPGGIYSYTLTNGEGDTDNNLFQLTGTTLKALVSFDYDRQNVFTIRVKASGDSGELESQLTINVLRSNGPVAAGDCGLEIRRLNFGIRDVEFNSQGNLFAACENGKLLRSANGGSTWTQLNSGVTAPLGRIAFRGTTGYISGNGVALKSDDNGNTWFQLFLPHSVYAHTAFFIDDNTGYVAGLDGELLQTTDGGRHWTLQGSPFFVAPSALWFWDVDNGIACDEFGSVVKTNNGGVSWYAADTDLIGAFNSYVSLAFDDMNTGLLATASNLYKSDDGGESWYEVNGISGENFTEVAFVGNGYAYVIGGYSSSDIWISMNNGVNWNQVDGTSITGVTGIAYRSGDNTVVLSGTNSSAPGAIEPGSAVISAPAGSSGWDTKMELRSQDFYAVEFPSESVGYTFGEFYSYKTTDGGSSWHELDLDEIITGAQFIDDQKGFAADGYRIYKTTNGGSSFTKVYEVDVGGTANLRKLVAVSADVIVAYSSFGTIYRTINGGTSWSVVYDEPLNQLMEVTFPTTLVGYGVDLLGKVIKTTNGGSTWSVVYSWSGSGEFFNTIAFVNATTGYMGGKDGLVLKTTNGGTSWSPVFGGIPSTINQFAFESGQEGYAFLEQGTIYRTEDGGDNWMELGNLSYIGLTDVDVSQGNVFYCGQYGNLGKIDERSGPAQPGYISGADHVCVGDKIAFEVAGSEELHYNWNVSGASLSANGNVAVAEFDNAGEYSLTVAHQDGCGTSASRSLTVRVDSPPEPVITGPETVMANSDEEYTIESPGPDSRYAWYAAGATSFSQEDEAVSVTWNTVPGRVSVMEIDILSGCRATFEIQVSIDPSTIVGVSPDANVLEAGVSIYPNPTADRLYIESTLPAELEVHVYDLMGKEYGHQALYPNDRGMLNFGMYPTGLYLIEISSPGMKEKVVKRIVKK